MSKILLISQRSVNFQSNIDRVPNALESFRNKVSIIIHAKNWGLNIYCDYFILCKTNKVRHYNELWILQGVCVSVCVLTKECQPIESCILLFLLRERMSTFEPN